MNPIRTYTAEDLGKTMPSVDGLQTMTAGEHFTRFYDFDTCDVWTADGWLITAVQTDGETHHMRKGAAVVVAKLEADTPLHFKHNAKSLRLSQHREAIAKEAA